MKHHILIWEKTGLYVCKWDNCDRYNYHIVSLCSEASWLIREPKYSAAPIEGCRKSQGWYTLSSMVSETVSELKARKPNWGNFQLLWKCSSSCSFCLSLNPKNLQLNQQCYCLRMQVFVVYPPLKAGFQALRNSGSMYKRVISSGADSV